MMSRAANLLLATVLVFLCAHTRARAQVIISEFLASNQSVLADEDGDFSDWIELHNPGASPVNLDGWYLTDDDDDLTKWRLPSTNLAANGYLVVFASNKDRAFPGSPLHTRFALGAGGEYLGLVMPDGLTIASHYAPTFPEQYQNISYGVFGGTQHFFATPTPGAPNSTNFFAKVADTKFSHDRGFYTAPFSLVITTATAGATIRFTTNGTLPALTNGLTYTTPIPINRTTVIRAASFKTGFVPANVDTQTYLFLDDVIYQSTNGVAPPGWPASWGANRVDYGMDPDVINNPLYSGSIRNDLKTIPTVSLVMKLGDLFDPSTGIYANSTQTGTNWERPASIELIYPDGTEGFQVNAGVRIRGGFSASSTNPKHSFRCFFRSEYGDSQLKYPLFGESGTDTFPGGFDLATFQNYSWSFSASAQGIFLRDHFARDTQLAMGHQGERGIYAHLYVNGQYWGIYSPSERTEASFAATYFGGVEEDYDVVKSTGGPNYVIEATDGDLAAWTRLWQYATNGFASAAAYQRVQGNHPDGSRNPAYDILVDVDNLIDYQLVVAYVGSRDAPLGSAGTFPNNWYGTRRRDGTMGFRFFIHDCEHSLLNVNDNRIGPYSAGVPGTGGGLAKSSPQYLWQQLFQQNAEFRLRVADHVHRFFFNDGLLTTNACLARFKNRTNQLDRAVVAESARWGDAQRAAPYTRNADWIPLVNQMLTSYFPQRSGIVLNQLKAANLYPNVDAPSFNQHGGNVTNGFPLNVTAPAGTIYFTRDGSDPRLPGGGVAPSAQVYAGPVTLFENATIKARVLNGGTWSALNAANFVIIRDFTGLLITEIMYHPPDEALTAGDEFEFIELKNVAASALDLSGVRFTNGIQFTFPNGTLLGPGEFVLLVSNPTAFASKYPGVAIGGVYSGKLSNAGEQLALVHAAGSTIVSLNYSDGAPWPAVADGQGFSIVPQNPNLNPDAANPINWRASANPGGSPGADDPSPNIAPVVINEILTHTDPPLVDSIELHNPGSTSADVSNWYLTDSRTSPFKFRLPSPTIIPAGGYAVFTAAQFNANPGSATNFLLSSTGEEVYLFSADAAGNLTGYSDGFSFGAAANGVSFGRYLTSTGEPRYPAQVARTIGATNAGPLIGPIVINEIRYRPLAGEAEFIELKNISTSPVKLFDAAFPTNTWTLSGVGFDFPMGQEILAGGLLVLTAGDPVAFRAQHGIPQQVPVFGPWAGTLQDNGELLQLQRPDAPNVTNGVVTVPYITVDDLRYRNSAPWPAAAAQGGSSLERIAAAAYGNDPINWKARFHGATPGRDNDLSLAPIVSAGDDLLFTPDSYPLNVPLVGSVVDDGPPESLAISWSQLSGPAVVNFSTTNLAETVMSFPRAGFYVVRLSAHDGEWQVHDEVTVTIDRTNYPVSLITSNSSWKYLDNGSNQGTAWRQPGFDDSSWATGNARFGYGDTNEATTISYGPVSTNKYITSYYRKTFPVADATALSALTVRLLRDDGAVVYLNGTEIFRSNMTNGVFSYTTVASSVVGGADENTYYATNVNPALLINGSNLLAVELHQANATGSDAGFDLELTGLTLGTNQAPTVFAGDDLAITLPQDAVLQGQPADDGLPLIPGELQVGWSRFTGPGSVHFANANAAMTTASFAVPGVYGLRLTASDGALSASGFMNVYVLAETFTTWAGTYFTPAEMSDPNVGGPPADPDADGFTNEQEFTAGTNPRDGQSYLRVETIATAGGVKIRFTASARRDYSIQYSSVLGAENWFKLSDVPSEATARMAEVLDAAPTNSARYYRVVTPAQP